MPYPSIRIRFVAYFQEEAQVTTRTVWSSEPVRHGRSLRQRGTMSFPSIKLNWDGRTRSRPRPASKKQRQGPGLRDFSVRRSLTFRLGCLGASRKLTDNTTKLSQPSSTLDPKGEKSDRQPPQHVLLRSNPFVRVTHNYTLPLTCVWEVFVANVPTLPSCKRLGSGRWRWIVG